MKRILVILAAAIAVLAPVATVASAAGIPGGRTQLRGALCQTALEPGARAIGATVVMRPIKGTVGLQLRFDLLRKGGSANAFTTVRGGDLGRWLSPRNSTLGRRSHDVWIINKQVVDLSAPAVYRLRASFRWIGAHHKVIGRTIRTGPRCYQPELRPDLRVGHVSVKPVTAKKSAYLVTIANAGATAAGAFSVQFAPGDIVKNVASLGAHRTTQLRFVGPACVAGVSPTITIDPEMVDDFNPSNNAATVTCPAS